MYELKLLRVKRIEYRYAQPLSCKKVRQLLIATQQGLFRCVAEFAPKPR